MSCCSPASARRLRRTLARTPRRHRKRRVVYRRVAAAAAAQKDRTKAPTLANEQRTPTPRCCAAALHTQQRAPRVTLVMDGTTGLIHTHTQERVCGRNGAPLQQRWHVAVHARLVYQRQSCFRQLSGRLPDCPKSCVRCMQRIARGVVDIAPDFSPMGRLLFWCASQPRYGSESSVRLSVSAASHTLGIRIYAYILSLGLREACRASSACGLPRLALQRSCKLWPDKSH